MQTQSQLKDTVAYAFAGFCCLLVGIGIARYAYTPLLPILVNQHWFSATEGGIIGASNFFGYFVGALSAKSIMKRFGSLKTIKVALILCTLSLLLCSLQLGLVWYYTWRMIAGIMAAWLMVAAPSHIYPHIPHEFRATASGILFSGVGIGIVASGLLVPEFALAGVPMTWILLALITLIPIAFVWFKMPNHETRKDTEIDTQSNLNYKATRPVKILGFMYFCFGIGFTPYILFIVAYITQVLKLSNQIGGLSWSIFGIGVVLGTLITGALADRYGAIKCLICGFILCILANIMVLSSSSLTNVLISSFIMGSFFISIVSLTSTKLSTMVPALVYPKFWGMITAVYAMSVALSAYLMSLIIGVSSIGYSIIFSIAIGFLCLGIVALFILMHIENNKTPRPRQSHIAANMASK